VFDVHQGVITLDLGEYLHQYNQFANVHMEFTMERFSKYFADPKFRMGLGGALGIKGNIVFSTSLHGIALGQNTMTPDYDCCVGDDALAIVFSHLFAVFVRFVNLLGSINDTKFSIVRRAHEDPTRSTSFKFVKRPLDLTSTGVPCLGLLDFFPDIASVLFPDGDGYHTLPPGSSSMYRLRSFVSQLSRFSIVLARQGFVVDNWDAGHLDLYADTEFLISCFTKCYNLLGLPVDGAKPGLEVYNADEDAFEILDLWVPPLVPELFLEGWIAACYWRYQGEEIEVPWCTSRKPPPLEVFPMMTFTATSDIPALALLEALGELESSTIRRTVRFDALYRRYLDTFYENRPYDERNESHLRSYRIIKVNPSWFDLFQQYYEASNDCHDILDNMT